VVVTVAVMVVIASAPTGSQGTSAGDAHMRPRRASEGLRPFPQHVAYTSGTIKPNHVTQTGLDGATTAFYETWKARYLKSGDSEGCEAGQFYVRFSPTGPTISVSEGHGYGMIITALMAGYDPNARAYFDGLYSFYKDHPSVNDPRLMAWRQVEGCVDADDGTGSATDGDMDIGYALLLAHAQWGSNGAINYLQQAVNVMQAIMEEEVNPDAWAMMLGDWVGAEDPAYYYGTRTSDFMPTHLRAFRSAGHDPRWDQVLKKEYDLVSAMQTTYSPGTGLLPDFIVDTDAVAKPAAPDYLEGPNDGSYYYNACRDPWRIGVDYLLSAEPRAKAAAGAINAWLRGKTGGHADAIRAGYALDGSDIEGNDYTTMAFVAPLGVGAMVDTANQAWLNGIWELVVSQTPEGYYEDTLKLLSMFVMSGNWWVPSAARSTYLPTVLENRAAGG
jgi:hypothetical protein